MNKKMVVTTVAFLLMSTSTNSVFAEAACKICGGWGHASAYGRLFNPKTIETVQGTILSVAKIAPLDTEDYGLSFLLATKKEEIHIHLGPTWYIDSEAMKFHEGDTVEVIGSRITIDDDPVIVVTEVRKDNHSMILRSNSGQAAWSGWKKTK